MSTHVRSAMSLCVLFSLLYGAIGWSVFLYCGISRSLSPFKKKGSNSYCKTFLKQPLTTRPKFGSQCKVSLNAGQKYCRMLQGEYSAIRLTFIKGIYSFSIEVSGITNKGEFQYLN